MSQIKNKQKTIAIMTTTRKAKIKKQIIKLEKKVFKN